MSRPTDDEIIAMRQSADKAGNLFEKIGLRLLSAEYHIRDLNIEIERSKKDGKNDMTILLVSAREEAKMRKDELNTRWNEQLGLQTSLWNIYCAALEAQSAYDAQAMKHAI